MILDGYFQILFGVYLIRFIRNTVNHKDQIGYLGKTRCVSLLKYVKFYS